MLSDILGKVERDTMNGITIPQIRVSNDRELETLNPERGTINLFGGGPGAGKSSLMMQLTVDALREDPGLKALVLSIETSAERLIKRQLSRISGIQSKEIEQAKWDREDEDLTGRIVDSLQSLREVQSRLSFVDPPFTLEHVDTIANEFAPIESETDNALILIDYVQRVSPSGRFEGDQQQNAIACMDRLRSLADRGYTILCVSSVSRQRDKQGVSSYADVGLASFKQSGDLEYCADNAFILRPANEEGICRLDHLKAKYSEARPLNLRFRKGIGRFESVKTKRTGGTK